MTLHDRLEMNPAIDGTQPVIKGTTITVGRIARLFFVEDWTFSDLVQAHPGVSMADLTAALEHTFGEPGLETLKEIKRGNSEEDRGDRREGQERPTGGGLEGGDLGVDPRSTYSRRCGTVELHGRHAPAPRDPFIDCVQTGVHIGACQNKVCDLGGTEERCSHCDRRFNHANLEGWSVKDGKLVHGVQEPFYASDLPLYRPGLEDCVKARRHVGENRAVLVHTSRVATCSQCGLVFNDSNLEAYYVNAEGKACLRTGP